MYLFGIKQWYANWILIILAMGIFAPLALYMLYRLLKDLFNAASQADYDRTMREEAREEIRLEELRKIREAIEKK